MQEIKLTLTADQEVINLLRRIAEALEKDSNAEKPKRTRKTQTEGKKAESPASSPTPPIPVLPTSVTPQVTMQQNMQPAPSQQPQTTPTATAFTQAAPVQAPVAPPQQYTLEMLQVATAPLMDAGLAPQLQSLLGRFGVQRLTDVPPEYYGAFATELRRLGARI